jgi:hypothetical protein
MNWAKNKVGRPFHSIRTVWKRDVRGQEWLEEKTIAVIK